MPTQALVCVVPCSFLIPESVIICKSGKKQTNGINSAIKLLVYSVTDNRCIHRPVNREELFNLRHAVARNVVERIFGVVKARWEILEHPAQFDMDIQVRIPPALAALHNFILQFDPSDIEDFLKDPSILDPEPGDRNIQSDIYGTLAKQAPTAQEKAAAEQKRDDIAEAMWVQYRQWLQDEGLLDNIELERSTM